MKAIHKDVHMEYTTTGVGVSIRAPPTLDLHKCLLLGKAHGDFKVMWFEQVALRRMSHSGYYFGGVILRPREKLPCSLHLQQTLGLSSSSFMQQVVRNNDHRGLKEAYSRKSEFLIS